MTTEQLKNCPFCGENLVQHPLYGSNWRHPETATQWCVISGVILDGEKWNTRPIEDALRAKLAIAVEALEAIETYPWEFHPSEKANEALTKIRGCE